MILDGFLFMIGAALALFVILFIIGCCIEAEKPRPRTMAEMLRERRLGKS